MWNGGKNVKWSKEETYFSETKWMSESLRKFGDPVDWTTMLKR